MSTTAESTLKITDFNGDNVVVFFYETGTGKYTFQFRPRHSRVGEGFLLNAKGWDDQALAWEAAATVASAFDAELIVENFDGS